MIPSRFRTRPVARLRSTATRSLMTVLLAALGVSGCLSSADPLRYHTLLQHSANSDPANAPTLQIKVANVRVPPQVDVPQLVLRRSGSELALAENHVWAAPLADEFRAALSADLVRRLGAVDVYGVPASDALPIARIQADIQRFESDVAGTVAKAWLAVTWSLVMDDGPPLNCGFDAQISGPANVDDVTALVVAHQYAIDALSAQIASAVLVPTACPQTPQP